MAATVLSSNAMIPMNRQNGIHPILHSDVMETPSFSISSLREQEGEGQVHAKINIYAIFTITYAIDWGSNGCQTPKTGGFP
jgi:hypothetical protein